MNKHLNDCIPLIHCWKSDCILDVFGNFPLIPIYTSSTFLKWPSIWLLDEMNFAIARQTPSSELHTFSWLVLVANAFAQLGPTHFSCTSLVQPRKHFVNSLKSCVPPPCLDHRNHTSLLFPLLAHALAAHAQSNHCAQHSCLCPWEHHRWALKAISLMIQ